MATIPNILFLFRHTYLCKPQTVTHWELVSVAHRHINLKTRNSLSSIFPTKKMVTGMASHLLSLLEVVVGLAAIKTTAVRAGD